jgi:hypothetical protein
VEIQHGVNKTGTFARSLPRSFAQSTLGSGIIPPMSFEPDDLQAKYSHMTEPELMALARDYDSLADPAQTALRAEFSHRNLEPPLVDEPATFEQRKLVTVKRYRDFSEAIVARSMLESAGITVYLFDENVVRLDWQISNMIGGIRVQVEEQDETAATEILNEPVPAVFTLDDNTPFEQPTCPVCGSNEISFQGSARGPALASLFLVGVPLPLGAESWLCDHCGAKWEDKPEEQQEPR